MFAGSVCIYNRTAIVRSAVVNQASENVLMLCSKQAYLYPSSIISELLALAAVAGHYCTPADWASSQAQPTKYTSRLAPRNIKARYTLSDS